MKLTRRQLRKIISETFISAPGGKVVNPDDPRDYIDTIDPMLADLRKSEPEMAAELAGAIHPEKVDEYEPMVDLHKKVDHEPGQKTSDVYAKLRTHAENYQAQGKDLFKEFKKWYKQWFIDVIDEPEWNDMLERYIDDLGYDYYGETTMSQILWDHDNEIAMDILNELYKEVIKDRFVQVSGHKKLFHDPGDWDIAKGADMPLEFRAILEAFNYNHHYAAYLNLPKERASYYDREHLPGLVDAQRFVLDLMVEWINGEI